jgi:hypothetical protein
MVFLPLTWLGLAMLLVAGTTMAVTSLPPPPASVWDMSGREMLCLRPEAETRSFQTPTDDCEAEIEGVEGSESRVEGLGLGFMLKVESGHGTGRV